MRQYQCNRALGLAFFYLLPALFAVLGVSPAFAQAPFYQGKTITLIVGAGPGGWVICGLKLWHRSSPNRFPEIRPSCITTGP